MSQGDVAQNTASHCRYSKRKRAEINYCQVGSDIEEFGSDRGSEDVEPHQRKKPKSARASRPLPKRKIFRFLELPPEIRNFIYDYALGDAGGIYLAPVTVSYRRSVIRTLFPHESYRYRNPYWNRLTPAARHRVAQQSENEEEIAEKVQPLVPNLLAVNKQIYLESRCILYGNDFYLENTLALHSFIVNIGPRAASLLRSVSLREWSGYRSQQKAYNHACFAVLTWATNIERLTLTCGANRRMAAKRWARQIYRDAFPWLEAVGAAKGKADAAVDKISLEREHIAHADAIRAREEDTGAFREELKSILNEHATRYG